MNNSYALMMLSNQLLNRERLADDDTTLSRARGQLVKRCAALLRQCSAAIATPRVPESPAFFELKARSSHSAHQQFPPKATQPDIQ